MTSTVTDAPVRAGGRMLAKPPSMLHASKMGGCDGPLRRLSARSLATSSGNSTIANAASPS
ncbi:hypothetical protein [Microbacterium lacticum]